MKFILKPTILIIITIILASIYYLFMIIVVCFDFIIRILAIIFSLIWHFKIENKKLLKFNKAYLITSFELGETIKYQNLILSKEDLKECYRFFNF